MPDIYDILFKKYKKNHNIFIETGTHTGGGVDKALIYGYSKVISVEPFLKDYDYCMKKFKKEIEKSRVTLYNGYSENELGNMLKNVNEPAVIFLDGHKNEWFEGGTHPLADELNIIENHHIKNHVIIIDDYEHVAAGDKLRLLIRRIQKINKNYRFEAIPQVNGILIVSEEL
jgi:hypothetical protein